MAGLTINEEREEYVTFTDSYYSASHCLIVPSNVTTFDDCKTADDVAAKLAETKSSDQIGVQQGTTGQYYVEGSEDWDFPTSGKMRDIQERITCSTGYAQ